MTELDNDTSVDAAYLDFRKAFDTVPHQRLITKLKSYNIQGIKNNSYEIFFRVNLGHKIK